ncbi:MAG: GntR family transcriptional regulator [Oscillospiraceae bacterium]|jgi:DNA-binding transcriptional regulator YhcF (GntR family)|nr:GntR family transcriptional regulator [Oscillospiraceae bacterium]
MSYQFQNDSPIYAQIVDRFKRDIARGALLPGERVTPVRELALTLGVSLNTLQRALTDLEREGLLYTERTAGRFVTTDRSQADILRRALSERTAQTYVEALRDMNFTDGDILALTQRTLEPHTNKKEEDTP